LSRAQPRLLRQPFIDSDGGVALTHQAPSKFEFSERTL
jgi:hypothetical protein